MFAAGPLRNERLITPLERTMSTLWSGSGMSRPAPLPKY